MEDMVEVEAMTKEDLRYPKAYLGKLFQGEETLHLLQLLTHSLVAWCQVHSARKGLQAWTSVACVDPKPSDHEHNLAYY